MQWTNLDANGEPLSEEWRRELGIEPAQETTMSDQSGWCQPRGNAQAEHERCDGTLRTATGYHWWCACPHHQPVPEPEPDTDAHRAWEVWKAARDV